MVQERGISHVCSLDEIELVENFELVWFIRSSELIFRAILWDFTITRVLF